MCQGNEADIEGRDYKVNDFCHSQKIDGTRRRQPFGAQVQNRPVRRNTWFTVAFLRVYWMMAH